MVTPEPDFVQRTRDSFANQPAMATLGVSLERVEPEWVALRMAHRPDLTQQHGLLDAGVAATALDSACGDAAFTLMPMPTPESHP